VHATIMMVLACPAWVRLLVTALLCVVGVARPIASRSDAAAALRGNEPMHVSSTTREAELCRERKRTVDDSSGDDLAVVGQRSGRARFVVGLADLCLNGVVRAVTASLERGRARGPPIG
jgi:hypothetical protein